MIDLYFMRRWFGPAFIAITIMSLYQVFAAPTIKDMIDDWNFLHAARMQAIIQQQQKAESR